MASRTKQKEEARARRMAEEQARQEREQRQRRVRMLGGTVILVILAVIVVVVIASGGSSSPKANRADQTAVSSLLNGIPQSGATLGNPKAPVTLTYYGDLECPICRDFTLQGGFGRLVANQVRQGRVKIVYRSFRTATPDQQTFQAQQAAALAAGQQNRFWNFVELFYRQQGAEGTSYVNDQYLTGLAQQVPGLDLSKWRTARNDPSLISQVLSDVQTGTTAGVSGTPTLYFQGPKGKLQVPGAVPDYTQLQQTLKSVA